MSTDTKMKISKAHKGMTHTEEAKKNIGKAMRKVFLGRKRGKNMKWLPRDE